MGNCLFQHLSRISLKRCSIAPVYITDQSCNGSRLRSPGQNRKGVKIRIKIHIRFLDSCKPFNGGAVKHALVVQCLLQLAYGNRHVLQASEHIGKLQTDKLHILFFYHS